MARRERGYPFVFMFGKSLRQVYAVPAATALYATGEIEWVGFFMPALDYASVQILARSPVFFLHPGAHRQP